MTLSRRQFVQAASVAGLGLVAGCGVSFWHRPPAPKVHRIGWLAGSPPELEEVRPPAFLQGLHDLGYVEGENLLIEWRHGSGRDDQLDEPAAELLSLPLDAIVVPSRAVASLLSGRTATVPIVVMGQGDLVGGGLAVSLARPGGNVTGLSTPNLAGKQLQLLQEAARALARVAVLQDATASSFARPYYEGFARTLGVEIQFLEVRSLEEVNLALDEAVREHADGLFITAGPVLLSNRRPIAERALQARLPSLFPRRPGVADGGLMSYAPDAAALSYRAAYFVDRIIKGTRPADLPIEQPTVFDFVLNLKTAQALGLTIPPHVLLQATEVIQ
jgi:putative ABC transport system substrate-binding protein